MNNTVHEDQKAAPLITLPEQYMKVPFLVFFYHGAGKGREG